MGCRNRSLRALDESLVELSPVDALARGLVAAAWYDDVSVAAWFIYLNKTSFNGPYRVNRQNKFNNPMGRMPNRSKMQVICDDATLRARSRALQGVELTHCDFRNVEPSEGDFVYLDPPYVPLSKTSDFRSYTAAGFSDTDHVALAQVVGGWKRKGVHVLLSNSSAELFGKLYERRGFRIDVVDARRSINARADDRGSVAELLVY